MFGSHENHHQGVHSRIWLKLLAMIQRNLSCARSIFGSVISEPVVCVCTVRRVENSSSQPVAQYTHTTGSEITLPNTDLAQDKFLWTIAVISVKYGYVLPDDGSHGIRNMLEWLLILCVLNFYTT